MKSWKLVFLALLGASSLASSACIITSDDDDDDDDDFGGRSGFAGSSGAGGRGGTGGTGGAGGAGGGAGGTGGAPTGTVTQFFGGEACTRCLDSMSGPASTEPSTDCGTVVNSCGLGGGSCLTFVGCLAAEQTEFERFSSTNPNDSLTCSLVTCGPQIVASPNAAEEQDLYICLVDKCFQACNIESQIPAENDPGIQARCPNIVQLESHESGFGSCRDSASAVRRAALTVESGASPRQRGRPRDCPPTADVLQLSSSVREVGLRANMT